jgi:tricorn protease
MSKMSFLIAFLCGVFILYPLDSKAQGTRLLRQPTISDNQIAFVYANDLWTVDFVSDKNKILNARRITSYEGAETSPHFSPDGKWIAFSGQYDGNTDVYIVSSEGGQPKRLTWHPGADEVTGWTPDGKEILFASGREGHPTAVSKLYTISVNGGMPKSLLVPRAANGKISEDGNFVAYTPFSFWDPEWRNYRGGQAQPIWILNLKDQTLKQTPRANNERHTNPVWLNEKVYFLSERDLANNVWSYDPATETVKQLTFHKQFDSKNIGAGGGKIVYEQGGYLHLLDPQSGESSQLNINIQGDFNWARPRWEDIEPNRLINASLSPTGQRALFEYRGEIFTVSKEEGNWRNITNSSGAADRFPVWSPDGSKIAWFSDASGEYQLVIGNQEGLGNIRSIKIPNATFFFKPEWSPNGKYIAFTDTDYNLWYIDIQSEKLTKADVEGYAHPNRSLNPVWSPDSKWIAYVRLMDNLFKAVKVHNVETGITHQLTNSMADAISPVWDASGKYLYFLATTNYGLNTGWLDMTSYDRPVTRSLYMMVLSKDTPSPLMPRLFDEKEQKAEDEKKQKEEKKKLTGKKETKAEVVQVKIDLDGLENRIEALDVPEKNYSALLPGPEGHVFYMESVPNESHFSLGRYSLEERKSTEFLPKVNEASVSHDRKNLLYRNGSNWSIVNTGNESPKSSDEKFVVSNMKLKIIPTEEWQQIFREGWRYQRDFLYVDNLHGAPWDKMLEWYTPWIDHVRHRSDLNYVVDILGGEVAVGHSYTSGGDFPNIDRIAVGLLGADYGVRSNRYFFSKIYNGESWNPKVKAPLSLSGLNVKQGDFLLEVNGTEVNTTKNLYSYFEGTAGRHTYILVNDKPSKDGARLITVVPVDNEYQLRSFAWIENNRRKVDEMSGGKLAYVYVPNTGQQGYQYFNRYYFAQQDKKGAIIDERNNGGGSAADYIVEVLARELHGYFNSRVEGNKPFTTPMAGIWGPKVMIINERAGSGGDLLPYLFRKMEIGPLVGTRTWGGLVGTWDTPPFVDGGRMVAPRGGFFDVDGNWAIEGEGVAPDIEVMMNPADVISGRDPQLERAVKEALQLLKENPVELKEEPAPPVRWKRPQGWDQETGGRN